MTRRLVVVESPAKARTLQRFLGSDTVVRATAGHVKDLPDGRLAIDLTNSYEPEYHVLRGKGHVLQELTKEARLADEVFLATDPDREGEAIAWHVAEETGLEGRAKRARIHEVTPAGIERALREAGPLDRARYDAQQARRVLDRLVGFGVSPLLSRAIKRGLSAGRVQSVALHALVVRERERRAFASSRWHAVEVMLAAKKGPAVVVSLADRFGPEEAEGVAAALRGEKAVVRAVARRDRLRGAPPPFVTAKLQQEAFERLHFGAGKTMRLAQRLFEGVELGEAGQVSLITYARTDAPRISSGAAAAARSWIAGKWGAEAVPERAAAHEAGKLAQEAHEAIRPVSVELTPELVKPHLERDLHRLYDRIWRRFVASQMGPARYVATEAMIELAGRTLRASGLLLDSPGFLAAFEGKSVPALAGETERFEPLVKLPPLEEGQALEVTEVRVEERQDEPPSPYSEATLLAELESRGIGRPSTYAAVVETLLDREYVKREGGWLTPTDLGFGVDAVLAEAVPELLDADFTAVVEAELDRVAAGEIDWVEVVRRFHRPIEAKLRARKEADGEAGSRRTTAERCEKCGAAMAIRWGRTGPFLSCTAYPACKHTRDLARPGSTGSVVLAAVLGTSTGGEAVLAREDEATAPASSSAAIAIAAIPPPLEPTRRGTCPRCGMAMVERRGRAGPFLSCSGYPACRTAMPLSTGVPCPACGEGEIAEKRARSGRTFFGCNRYPACSHVMRERPVARPCPKCGAGYVVQRFSRRDGAVLVCAVDGCGHWRPLAEELAE